MEFGNLFIVSTPIGNLEDFSTRAINTLAKCDIIACEDTRVSLKLLNKFDIKSHLISYHDNNEIKQTSLLIKNLHLGKNVAIICDAGTPTISDPGFRIIRECKKQNINVIPIPGPSAAITAISASGLPSNSFLFLGFPGNKDSARVKILNTYISFPHTLIFYESCHRIEKFLNNILNIMGNDRVVSICKELTKLHETILTNTISSIIEKIKNISLKGEFVVLISPENFVI